MHRTPIIILFALLTSVTAFGQTSYKGLTPGKSTRVQAERVLGQPVTKVSETLIEYRPQPLTSKVYVQYRTASPVIERIEIYCRPASPTCDEFIKSLNLRLPDRHDAEAVRGEKFRLYYGQPLFIVTAGDMADATSDSFPASRLSFFSRELYEADLDRVKADNQAAMAKYEEESKKPPPLTGFYGEITGIVKVKAANGSAAPIAGAIVDFYRTDISGHSQTTTNKYGTFQVLGLSQTGSWVVVVSGPGMKWAYLNGVRTPVGGLEIIAERGDGARPTYEQVLEVQRLGVAPATSAMIAKIEDGRATSSNNSGLQISAPQPPAPDIPSIGARVVSMRFYETDRTPNIPVEQRQYRTRFPKEGTRFVNYELSLQYPDPGHPVPVSVTSLWYYNQGAQPFKRMVNEQFIPSNSTGYLISQGSGQDDGRGFEKWPGTFTVELFIEGRRVGVGTFEIY